MADEERGAVELKIAILGVGSIGRRHIANLLAMGERDLLIHDSHPGQLVDAGATFGLHSTGRPETVWDWRPDAVLICTPPDSHEALIWDAYNHDADVFVEKPLALKMPALVPNYKQRVLGAGRNWVNMVASPLKWHDSLRQCRDRCPHSAVFRCYYDPSPRKPYMTDTGSLLDIGSHEVDVARWILGDLQLIDVGHRGEWWRLTLEGQGTRAVVGVGWGPGNYLRDTEFNDGEFCWTFDPVEHEKAYHYELAHFLDCVRDNKPTCNPIESAVETLRILLEAKQCAQSQ